LTQRRRFLTIGQIDATGIRGPHARELIDMSKAKAPLFKDIQIDVLEKITKKDLGAIVENIGFDEDWTLTLEIFPEVNIHISYFYYGGEFGDTEAELKFLYSGNRVYLISGKELFSFNEIIINFIERRLKNEPPLSTSYKENTELMQKNLKKRRMALKFLNPEDKSELEKFLEAKVVKTDREWKIKKEIFPNIFIELKYDENQKELDTFYSGENLEKIGIYEIELLAIYLINHILRFITLKNNLKDLPDICYMVFSNMLLKEKNWEDRILKED